MPELTDADYQRLLAFRNALRRFLTWSAEQAQTAGLTPHQHQLLLAIRGHSGDAAPTITELAGALLLRHHSAVELIDRAERLGLVSRAPDEDDRRRVRIHLTSEGHSRIEQLSAAHAEELAQMGMEMFALGDLARAKGEQA